MVPPRMSQLRADQRIFGTSAIKVASIDVAAQE